MKRLWLVPMICIVVFNIFVLNGCAYRTDLEQGQNLSAAQVQSVHTGMSRQTVLDTLGVPVLENPYNSDHMIYVYTMLPVHGAPYKKQLVLTMNQGQVADIASMGY